MASRFDPDDDNQLGRLLGAVETSRKAKQPFEEVNRDLLGALVGEHYGRDTKVRRPVNAIEFNSSVFLRSIVPHAPKAMVGSDYQELLPFARDMELALNLQMNRMDLRDTLYTSAQQAMFSMGAMEVGITTGDTPPDGEGHLYDPGQLFADPILFEDLILDMSAKHWNHQGFMGHEFVVPVEWAQENPNFDKKLREKLRGGDKQQADIDSNQVSVDRTVDEFEETIRLRQLFLPRQKLVLIFACEGTRPLQVIDWTGPERGPYHFLAFGRVPGNIIPLAPALLWYDLDSIINEIVCKVADQAIAQKNGVGVKPHAIQDGQKIVEFQDGDVIPLDDTNIAKIAVGGADQTSLGFALWARNLLNSIAGNPELLAGTGPQSRTVGQDQLMADNASQRLRDMQDSMRTFQKGIVEDLAYWLWTDPISEFHLQKPVGDGSYSIPVLWTPERRMGEFAQYNFDINLYQDRQRSPSEQGEFLAQRLMNILLPVAQLMAPEGKVLDWEDILKTLAKYDNTPEFARWVKHTNGEMYPQRQPLEPRMPQFTQRHYTRENIPAASRQGQDQVLARLMFGGESQGSEMASLMRSAG